MRARRQAALGLAIAGAGYGLWLPNMVAFSPLEAGLTVVQAVALLAAGAALALPDAARSRGLLAGALVAGAGARVGSFAQGPFGDLTTLNGLFATAGWLLLAWYALLQGTEAAPRPRRLAGMRLGLLTIALGNGLWIPYNVATGTYEWMPGNLLLLTGMLAAARGLGAPGAATAEPRAETGSRDELVVPP